MLVESDCMKVVQALHISVELSSLFGLVVLDCRQLLQDIVNVEVCFIRRSANRVAHCLARQSYFHSERSFSELDVPGDILSLCMRDI